jgi:CHAT domain-containing protein
MAKAEAEAVAKAHGARGRPLINPTRAQFTALPLADFACLHFATHGSSVLASSDDPMQASIWFADGPLTGWQIASLPLRAALVVLAACHSGQRAIAGRGLDRLPGDDLFGLAGALFEAGVNAVLGTLWPVQDEAAKTLVVAFHHAYAHGDDPADALCKTVRAHLAQRKREVFFWAPFFVSSLGRA